MLLADSPGTLLQSYENIRYSTKFIINSKFESEDEEVKLVGRLPVCETFELIEHRKVGFILFKNPIKCLTQLQYQCELRKLKKY